MKKILFSVVVVAMLWSCGKDDSPDTPAPTPTPSEDENGVPVMAAQEFTASEDITAADEIGPVAATDPDGDTLTFSITDSDLFVISDAGVLTLAEGKTLDFETAASHSVTVSVTDGEETVEATMTITVEDVAEADPNDKAAFVTTWKTEADGEEISILLWNTDEHTNNFTINWGDGTVEHIDVVPEDELLTHTYDTAGTYSVAIQGELPWFGIEVNSRNKLMSIDQWGSIEWQSFGFTFNLCKNMMYNAEDAPDLSNVKSMQGMFSGAEAFNADLNGWNTSNVKYMNDMFRGATSFNGDISSWDTGSVIDMSRMFYEATSFNGNLSGWDVSNVTNMNFMFFGATSFNGDLSSWDTSNVTGMVSMFSGATSFDQSLGAWDISSVTIMPEMLNNTAMSTDNYENTLLGWSTLDEGETQVPLNITLGATGLTYCTSAGKTVLVDDFSWTINDDGFDPNCL